MKLENDSGWRADQGKNVGKRQYDLSDFLASRQEKAVKDCPTLGYGFPERVELAGVVVCVAFDADTGVAIEATRKLGRTQFFFAFVV